MKILKFLLALAIAVGGVWFLSNSHNIKGAPVPALGTLLNPFSGIWQNATTVTAGAPSDVLSANLKGKVEVKYDERMIPHIFAENTADMLFTQGYLHAQNRLFQMDFLTRFASGRLSEILGESSPLGNVLRGDKLMRRRGMVLAAENTLAAWQDNAKTMEHLNAYVAGANAYIEKMEPKNYPVEYKLLGFAPEKWSPLKIALVMKYMAYDLCSREDDLEALNVRQILGGDFQQIFPATFPEQSPIIPSGTNWNFDGNVGENVVKVKAMSAIQNPTDVRMTGFQRDAVLEKPDENNGSNNWAVAPSKTINKKPILAGDPHLSLRLPSIWYENQLISDEMNVYGASIPGVPFVIIGFNEHVAWSPTNVGHDVADWYSINWTSPQKDGYTLDGKTQKPSFRIEKFVVKSKKDTILDTIRMTHWGPVVYEDSTMKKGMAYRWLAHTDPFGSDMLTFYGMNKAKSYTEFSKSAENLTNPAQNFAFISQTGDIALRVTGHLPARQTADEGKFVMDGSNSANGWSSFVPTDRTPMVLNPARGFVSSCNQHSTDGKYPYFYHSMGFDQYRGRYTNLQLAKMDSITVDDMKALQNDNTSLFAMEILPEMIKNLDSTQLSAPEKLLLDELKAWNYKFDAELVAPISFDMWYDKMYDGIWDEILTQPNPKDFVKPSQFATYNLLRGRIDKKYFDIKATPAVETAQLVVTDAFRKMAVDFAKEKALSLVKAKGATFTWKDYKSSEIPFLMTLLKGFGRLDIPNGGHRTALNCVKKSHGPSWRMVVELGGESPNAWVIYPGGQSGNMGNKNYDAFVDTWTKGEYYQAIFLRKAQDAPKGIVFSQKFSKS